MITIRIIKRIRPQSGVQRELDRNQEYRKRERVRPQLKVQSDQDQDYKDNQTKSGVQRESDHDQDYKENQTTNQRESTYQYYVFCTVL